MSTEPTSTPGSDPAPDPTPSPKMVPESDVIAVKEGARKELEGTRTAHAAEIKIAKDELSTAQNKLYAAEARVTELEGKLTEHTSSAEELARTKGELETAQGAVKSAQDKALEYRRNILVTTYGIPADTVSTKTMEQLDSYEEALKAVKTAQGVGNYALGGGGGGAPGEKLTPIEQAAQELKLAKAAQAKRRAGGDTDYNP